MDIKIEGITQEIMQIALKQAKAARLHILGVMDEAIAAPAEELSEFAPRIYTMKIHSEENSLKLSVKVAHYPSTYRRNGHND